MDGKISVTVAPPGSAWIPIRLSLEGKNCRVTWCDFSGARFEEPFFDQSVSLRLQNPCCSIFQPETLWDPSGLKREEAETGTSPGGLIFHLSRCGSTLLTRLLAALPEAVVLSEPAPLHQLLSLRRRHPGHLPEETWRDLLRALVSLMGRLRFPGEQRWFLKCDAIHTLDIPFILSAFPGIPWVFLHRDPVEIVVAHLDQPSGIMIPGCLTGGYETLFSPGGFPAGDHIAKVLALLSQAALRAPAENSLFLNYHDLTREGWPALAQHFGIPPARAMDESVTRAMLRDAKSSGSAFQPDSESRQQRATPAVRAAVTRWLGELYPALCRR